MINNDVMSNAGELANSKLLTCQPNTPIYLAAKLIKEKKTSSILVEDKGKIVGIWTEADGKKITFEKNTNFYDEIKDYMSTPVLSIIHSASIQDIIMAFHRHRVRHLLVVDDENRHMGIISQTDVVKKQGLERYLELRKIENNFNPKVPVISGDRKMSDVAQKMSEFQSTSAIIKNPKKTEYGIITERDLLRLIADKNNHLSAWSYAAHPLVTIEVKDSLYNAYIKIKHHNVRHLVVCDNEEIKGILSLQHILSDIEIAYIEKLHSVLHERDTALKESRKHLSFAEKIIEESLDSIMVTDKRGVVLSVNPAFTRLTGYTENEIIGVNASILSSGLHDDAFYQKMWSQINQSGTWQGEIQNKKKNGDIYSEWLTIVRLGNKTDSEQYFTAIFSDITERKMNEERIHALAFYDDLTGLPNRRLFDDRFEVALSMAHRNNQLVAVLFLDLDRFKQINDNLGHRIGDELLKETSTRILSSTKEGDTVSRFGGDEFVILLSEMLSVKDIVNVVERISKVLNKPYNLGGRELHVTTSIGVAIYPDDGKDTETLLKHADVAMYKAKDIGRNTFQLYSPEMNAVSMERLIMQNCLQTALKKNEFELFYQLKINQQDNSIAGVEALIRWNHPELGQVSPGQFIPLAEELGLIVDIDCWVLNQACLQRKQWHDKGIACGSISVNISALHFCHDLIQSVEQALNISGLPPELLELEVTEGCFIRNIENARTVLTNTSNLGVKSSIDDFGTGYSSLSYLSQLSFDTLKIDASFVTDVPHDPQQCQIVSSIIALAKALNVDVVAEGVETKAQVNFLADKNCNVHQGYYFSRPSNSRKTTEAMQDYLSLNKLNIEKNFA